MNGEGLAPTATVAVAGGKGGCGKTTATIGLAAALADAGRRPVAVDADVDLPDLHIRAGVPVEPGLPAARAARPSALVHGSDRFPGVGVLPAGATTATAAVGTALSRVAAMDRPVVLDCPAGAGPDAAAPLRAADATLVVCSATPTSRRDATKTTRMARALDAPPVAWAERDRHVDDPRRDPSRAVPTVRVPVVERRPLSQPSVIAAFDRLRRTVFDL